MGKVTCQNPFVFEREDIKEKAIVISETEASCIGYIPFL